MSQEFILALTEHRALGNILVPLLIEKEKSYYIVSRIVKMRDVKSGIVSLPDHQLEILKNTENYNDEILVKKFSKKNEGTAFFQNIDKKLLSEHIQPYLDKYIFRCIVLLMTGTTRLFYKQAKYSHLYDEDQIIVNQTFSDSLFSFTRDQEGTKYQLQISHEGKHIELLHRTVKLVSTQPGSFVLNNQLYVFRQLSGKKIVPFLTKTEVSISRRSEDLYFQTFILNTIKESAVKATGFDIVENCPDGQTILSLEQDLSLKPAIIVKFKYNEKTYLSDTISNVSVSLVKNQDKFKFTKIARNRSWEENQLEIIKKLGLKYRNGFWYAEESVTKSGPDTTYQNILWLSHNHQELENLKIKVQQTKLSKKYYTGTPILDIQVKTNEDWFDIYAIVKIGDLEIQFIKIRKLIVNNIREYELPSGEIVILPLEWFSNYRDIFAYAKLDGDVIKIKKHHFQLLKNQENGIDPDYFNKLEKLYSFNNQSIEVPSDLQATLRNYQKDGFAWMLNLHDNHLGGCLADDMGLGKTIQVLTLLLKIRKKSYPAPHIPDIFQDESQLSIFDSIQIAEQDSDQKASLIVMPSSLIHNWSNEIKKFAPSLRVSLHLGAQRNKTTLARAISHFDVILTTYGTLRNDYEMMRSFEFDYLILDESQYIKNATSKIYKSIIEIKSKHKLVITGTPIENSLSDLWSQFNFINRGILGSLAYFQREFIVPIEKNNSDEQQLKLQRLIRPFLLRRTKDQVEVDLPSLTEQITYCEMADKQREIYETEKSAIRNHIFKNIESNGINKSAIIVLQGLTRLRQLANHPSLVTQDTENESGKFDEIFRSLENLVAENHKVLIFSSFVKHLDLLKTKIETENWKYSMLTGKTINREEVIREFQETNDNHIFLISLKAGGVGLNLTSADYVFIIDPWWNPAAENQAIKRAHRIGQDKKVFVYRFITEDTIEEKIQILKSKKSALADKFISANNPVNALTQAEIMSLFS